MRETKMKVLFIARNYPPDIGGAEKLNYELAKNLRKNVELKVVSNRFGRYSPLFHLYAFIKALTTETDVILLSDPYLSPLIPPLKSLKRKPIAIKAHGLEIVYPNIFYQLIIPKLTNTADKVICISNATKEECVKRGINPKKCIVIPAGISDELYLKEDKSKLRKTLSEKINIDLDDRKIILSVGRLVRRKGFHWFIENVIPKLIKKERSIIYLIAGDGPHKATIESIINKKHLDNYVKLLGKVDDKTLKLLYNVADVFVMPNIPVKGDMEGLGIVILEASSCGIPVVASNLEGIRDAVVNGENGILVDTCNAEEFVKAISKLLKNSRENEKLKKRIRDFTLKNYKWEKIAKRYLETLKTLHSGEYS